MGELNLQNRLKVFNSCVSSRWKNLPVRSDETDGWTMKVLFEELKASKSWKTPMDLQHYIVNFTSFDENEKSNFLWNAYFDWTYISNLQLYEEAIKQNILGIYIRDLFGKYRIPDSLIFEGFDSDPDVSLAENAAFV